MPGTEPPVSAQYLRALLSSCNPPPTPRVLHSFIEVALGADIATMPLIAGSSAPFDYLVHTFFEGAVSPRDRGVRTQTSPRTSGPADAVVWAARGAGKTFLGAVATTLDLLFKPGIDIRLLGGSLEQAQRMHEHLRRLFERPLLAPFLADRITDRRVELVNGSRAQILAQSQTSVRGTRVQKLRCDEVELFDPQVWHAAQLTTRSMNLSGPWGNAVRGSVEALSTMHRPHGLMWNLVTEAGATRSADNVADPRRAVFRWGLIDVLAPCGSSHECRTCSLEPECGGRAKARDARGKANAGHVSVDDAVRMKGRVAVRVWESEMLCLRPRRSDCVLPEFDVAVHTAEWPAPEPATSVRWIAGMDFGIRAPTVALLAWCREDDPERVLYVESEHVQTDWTVDQHADVLLTGRKAPEGWPRPVPPLGWVGVDPAGHQRSEQTGISSIAVLRKAGLQVRSRRLPLHQGLDLLRARLKPAASASASGSSPRLFIHRRCTKLIESLSKYHFPEDRPESLDPVKDGSDHAVDALRYLLVCLDRPHETRLISY